MCGIAGYFGKEYIDKSVIDRTFKSLHHRGPDSIGFIRKMINQINFIFYIRLNILDIKNRSNQPYHLGAHTLIFNGEIYNYLEIKALLVKEGVI